MDVFMFLFRCSTEHDYCTNSLCVYIYINYLFPNLCPSKTLNSSTSDESESFDRNSSCPLCFLRGSLPLPTKASSWRRFFIFLAGLNSTFVRWDASGFPLCSVDKVAKSITPFIWSDVKWQRLHPLRKRCCDLPSNRKLSHLRVCVTEDDVNYASHEIFQFKFLTVINLIFLWKCIYLTRVIQRNMNRELPTQPPVWSSFPCM